MGASTTALKSIDPVALRSTVEGLAKELLLPGAMVLLHTPQGDFVFGYGTTELGVTNPPRADTHFRAASNTKTMTAAVIVQLAQEGKLRLDDPISKFVQDVPNGDNITIGQLLKMRSGLYNYTAAPELAESLDRDPTKVWSSEELRAIAFKRPPLFAPGAEFDYCNTNYLLLGLVAEKIEGAALGQHLSEPLVRAAWHEEHSSPYRHVERHPGAVLTWLSVRRFLIRFGGCALSRRSSGCGQGGNAQAQ